MITIKQIGATVNGLIGEQFPIEIIIETFFIALSIYQHKKAIAHSEKRSPITCEPSQLKNILLIKIRQ